jgi:hypothetical protein
MQVLYPRLTSKMTNHRQQQRKRLKRGEKVVLTALPPGFIDDLPEEDQRAISKVVGKPITLNKYQRDGRAELEFADSEDVIHLIYVDPKFIKLW